MDRDRDTEQTLRAELASLRERLEWIEKELDREQPVPLSEQVWYYKKKDSGDYVVGCDGRWIATAFQEKHKDIIMNIPKLVKVCQTVWPALPEGIATVLLKMGVVVE